MGLAPYGRPKYVQAIYDHLLDLKPDGTFRLNMDYFNYCTGLTMTNGKFDSLFRWPSPKTREPADATGNGPGALGAGHYRRSHAAALRARCNGKRAPRISAWPAASRSTASATAGFCAKVHSRELWIQPAPAMPAAQSAPHMPPGINWMNIHGRCNAAKMRCAARYLGPRSRTMRSRCFLKRWVRRTNELDDGDAALPGCGGTRFRESRRLASRAAWSSVRARLAGAAFWAIRAVLRCSRS